MKFQDFSFNGLKVTVGTKSVTHPRTHARSKSNMPHQLFQSWGHKQRLLTLFWATKIIWPGRLAIERRKMMMFYIFERKMCARMHVFDPKFRRD